MHANPVGAPDRLDAIRSGTHSVPIGVPGGWGLVGWEKTLGDLLTEGGYACAAYGKWHVGEGPGRLADRPGIRGVVRAAAHLR